MKSLFEFLFLFISLSPFISAKQIHFFRKDYTYNETFDAFYKLHWNYPVFSWDAAFLACEDEGASLFYPKDKEELNFVRHLAADVAKRHHDNITDIILGLQDKYNLGEFITVDVIPLAALLQTAIFYRQPLDGLFYKVIGRSSESSLSVTEPETAMKFPSGYCVLMDINRGSFRVGPCASTNLQEGLNFVCRKENSVMCPTIDQDYKHAKSLRKCYKINRRQKMWHEAYQTCHMEGGILAVIQDKNEASWLKAFLGNNQATYHVGTHTITPGGEIYTVKGQKFDTVYQRLYNNDETELDCGAIRIIGSELYTVTTFCSNKLPFICEIELNDG